MGNVRVGQSSAEPKTESLENGVKSLDKKSEEDKIKLLEEKNKIREKII